MERLTKLALRVLEEALAQAEAEIVEPHVAHRLALQWLVAIGALENWQARSFIEAMGAPILTPHLPGGEHYIRPTLMRGTLLAAYYGLGNSQPPEGLRASLARRFATELLDQETGQPHPWVMCNRYRPGERETIRQHFDAKLWRQVNDGPGIVHPKDPGWVVRAVDGELVLDQMTWGFPVVLRGKKGQPLKPKPVNNARFDKLSGFWARWAGPAHRCLIPASAYAEPMGETGSMKTAWLTLRSTSMFAWAGLWRESEDWGPVYTGVMTRNAPELASIHDRSPVILAREDWETWLNAPLADLQRFDRPWPADDVFVMPTDISWKDGGREELVSWSWDAGRDATPHLTSPFNSK